eukprot:scaffold1285_cov243-Pinguiococcus_pyrenoidosus.AAC.1
MRSTWHPRSSSITTCSMYEDSWPAKGYPQLEVPEEDIGQEPREEPRWDVLFQAPAVVPLAQRAARDHRLGFHGPLRAMAHDGGALKETLVIEDARVGVPCLEALPQRANRSSRAPPRLHVSEAHSSIVGVDERLVELPPVVQNLEDLDGLGVAEDARFDVGASLLRMQPAKNAVVVGLQPRLRKEEDLRPRYSGLRHVGSAHRLEDSRDPELAFLQIYWIVHSALVEMQDTEVGSPPNLKAGQRGPSLKCTVELLSQE